MLTRSRDTQMDKAKRTIRDVAKYAQDVAQDERLRADLSAALAHGSKAGGRVKKGIEAGGIYETLADDQKLRKNLRAMLDDLDSASDRLRHKQSNRVRTVVVVLAGIVAAAVAWPKLRSWISSEDSESAPVV